MAVLSFDIALPLYMAALSFDIALPLYIYSVRCHRAAAPQGSTSPLCVTVRPISSA